MKNEKEKHHTVKTFPKSMACYFSFENNRGL
jgi:hypothetical protein